MASTSRQAEDLRLLFRVAAFSDEGTAISRALDEYAAYAAERKKSMENDGGGPRWPPHTEPLSPSEWRRRIDGDLESAVRASVARINEALLRATALNPVSVDARSVGGDGPASYDVAERVAAAFRAAGWKVEHSSDQRDGDYYTFAAPAERGP
jgi:nicotinamidase-related amidase